MDQKEIVEKAKKDLGFLFQDVLGVLLYGSWARGEGHEKSDIDIIVVAPEVEDKMAFWRSILSGLHDDRYDVRIFELMPLYLKMAAIEEGVVVYARNVYDLYEYFYPFRKIWDDQKGRQRLTKEDALVMFGQRAHPKDK